MARRLDVVAVTATIVLAACQSPLTRSDDRPSELAARQVLAQYVAAAASTDSARSYCSISFLGDSCERDYKRAGGDRTKPHAQPTVVASRAVDRDILVLVICGTDGAGKSYQSDFPVERDENGELRAVIPVFWAGTTFSGVRPDEGSVIVGPGEGEQAAAC